jgi:hypothetical protein
MMKSLLTRSDVLSDIEFELAQGAISRNELGQSVQAVKQYHNKVRSEVFQSSQVGDNRESLGRLFQINDMLITLLQEMVTTIESLRLDLRRVAVWASQGASPAAAATATRAPVVERDSDMAAAGDVPVRDGWGQSSHWRPPADVEQAMRPEALRVESEARSTGIPVIGRLIQRLRIALHSVALFYVVKLARKQVVINQTYGDWILHLGQLNQRQQEQIDWLNAQVSSLQAHLAEVEEASPPATDS